MATCHTKRTTISCFTNVHHLVEISTLQYTLVKIFLKWHVVFSLCEFSSSTTLNVFYCTLDRLDIVNLFGSLFGCFAKKNHIWMEMSLHSRKLNLKNCAIFKIDSNISFLKKKSQYIIAQTFIFYNLHLVCWMYHLRKIRLLTSLQLRVWVLPSPTTIMYFCCCIDLPLILLLENS